MLMEWIALLFHIYEEHQTENTRFQNIYLHGHISSININIFIFWNDDLIRLTTLHNLYHREAKICSQEFSNWTNHKYSMYLDIKNLHVYSTWILKDSSTTSTLNGCNIWNQRAIALHWCDVIFNECHYIVIKFKN